MYANDMNAHNGAVRGYVAPTDRAWFAFLSDRRPSEVNFWRPSATGFSALRPGEPLFFKLKAPLNVVGGLGWFAGVDVLPAWLAWETFEEANGAADEFALVRSLGSLAGKPRSATDKITCISLVDPIFLPRDAWIAQPADWRGPIVAGKGYDLGAGEGARMLREVLEAAGQSSGAGMSPTLDGPRYGKPTLRAQRLGQGMFARQVIDAYQYACAVTGECALPALQASHIKPYSQGGEHTVQNGLALRSDIHRLFDLGYATITTDYQFVLSERLRMEFPDTIGYGQWHDTRLGLPEDPTHWPDSALLRWHHQEVYLG